MLRQAEASDRVRLRRTACAFPHPIANFFETAASEPQLSFHRNPNRLAWVANTIDPTMLQLEANLQTLTEWLDCPLLGVLPFQEQLDVRQLAGLMDLSRLE